MEKGRKGHVHGCACDMRGMLGFLILFLLSKKPMHGQEIAGEIGRRKGATPSPGTIYPSLKKLKEDGLISSSKSGKEITYSLTPSGKKSLHESIKHFCATFHGIYS